MPAAISICPKCQKPVSVPADVDSEEMVRCPLCDVEYQLAEAIPPELIPVNERGEESQREGLGEIFIAVEPRESQNFPADANNAAGNQPAVGYRPRTPQKSALRIGFEIVAGGLAGCIMAYYLLAVYLGPQFRTVGLPKFNLPGITWLTAPRTPSAQQEPETASPSLESDNSPKSSARDATSSDSQPQKR